MFCENLNNFFLETILLKFQKGDVHRMHRTAMRMQKIVHKSRPFFLRTTPKYVYPFLEKSQFLAKTSQKPVKNQSKTSQKPAQLLKNLYLRPQANSRQSKTAPFFGKKPLKRSF